MFYYLCSLSDRWANVKTDSFLTGVRRDAQKQQPVAALAQTSRQQRSADDKMSHKKFDGVKVPQINHMSSTRAHVFLSVRACLCGAAANASHMLTAAAPVWTLWGKTSKHVKSEQVKKWTNSPRSSGDHKHACGDSSWYVTQAPPPSQLIMWTCAVASHLILKVSFVLTVTGNYLLCKNSNMNIWLYNFNKCSWIIVDHKQTNKKINRTTKACWFSHQVVIHRGYNKEGTRSIQNSI